MGSPTDITLADFLEIQNVAYDWADCYDTKDWDRLKRTVLGPTIRLDFRSLGGPLQEDLTPDQYVAIIGDRKVIGDPRVKTQHLLGASRWSTPGNGTVQVWWQLRAAHQRYATEDLAEPISHADGHGANQHTYQKVDGSWRIVGIDAKHGWTEGDLHGTLQGPEGA